MSLARRQVVARGLLAATVAIGGFEGLRQAAYLDPVGVPTVCFGETLGVRLGDEFSAAACEELLAERVLEFDDAVTRCIGYAPSAGPRAAFVSLAYNIGAGAFCASTLARLARDGDIAGACAQLDRFVYAKGIRWPGLVKRRAAERAMCERDLA
jgi:lysozyme